MLIRCVVLFSVCGWLAGGVEWRTATDLTGLFPEEDLWSTRRNVPFAELANGAEAVERQGARWTDHPRFPTIHTTAVPADWSGAEHLVWRIHSAKATNQRLLVGVLCDNPATHARDFRVAAIRVDWTGWRELVLPLAAFSSMGDPLGWDQVAGLYVFTKVFHWQPHPETELILGEFRLGSGAEPSGLDSLPAPPVVAGIEVSFTGPAFDGHWFNHAAPEIDRPDPLDLPLVYEPYFLTERALRRYFPRFMPGAVSFAPDGQAWILAGGHILQTCDAQGQWQMRDLLPLVADYVRREMGWPRMRIWSRGQLNEGVVRFDSSGDMYVLVALFNPDGDWRSRTGLLLHGRNGGRDWDVHRLPYYMARFEKLVGHNRDALSRPPVLLVTRYHAPNESFLLLPEKQADGSLVLPDLVQIGGDDTIGFLPHSGEANQALSVGDGIYVPVGRLAVLPGNAREDGVPNYIVRYDRGTGRVSDPVFLGFGGRNALDNHNWTTLAVDSRGVFHAIVNGHHDPFRYTHGLAPGRIDRWSEPIQESAGTSYAGLVVGPDDTLYSVTRCSIPGYYFRLTLHRKRPGQDWEQQHLVTPFKPYYHVWYHKLSIEPGTGRLFLFYAAQAGQMCLFRDELEAFIYQRPDLAASMLGQDEEPKLPLGTYRTEGRKYAFYSVPSGEPGILVSADGGDTWNLGTTADFLPR